MLQLPTTQFTEALSYRVTWPMAMGANIRRECPISVLALQRAKLSVNQMTPVRVGILLLFHSIAVATASALAHIPSNSCCCPSSTEFMPWTSIVLVPRLPWVSCPAWGRGTPFPSFFSLVHLLPYLLLFVTFSLFPFLIRFTYFLLLSISFLFTRTVPLRFQARGRSRRPNLGLVCCVHFVLSVLLS